MLKILLALLVVSLTAALWLLSDTLGLPSWAAAWATVAALFLLVGMVALELLQRRSRRLRDQKRQAERSPFHQTLGNLRSRCEHALETLRAQNAEALPWVLLLGPSGAGKTAALRSSGVRFLDGLGPERFITGGDVSPTESVQFLASDRLVFVDTAGRYLCETPDHEDRREWLALLNLLRTQRADRPLTAIVLTVSADALARTDPEAAASLGLGLRRRLEDIQREFTATFPVYILVTRIDELAGISRLVAAELNARDPSQGEPTDRFGFEVELSGAGASSARRVAEGPLADLSLALERRAFALIEQSSTPEERGEIYRAPGHFRRLAERSADLLGTLFPDHGQADAPIFRGLYFASAGASTVTPAAPADLELQALTREYGNLPQRGSGPAAPLARPAFLRGLFAQVLPEDSWIAGWTRRRQGQQRVRHGLRVALLSSAALGALSLSLGSAQSNHRLQGELSAAITAVQSDPGDPRLPLRPANLAPIQAVHNTLHAHREDGAPWSLRLGLYQGAAVADEVDRVYFTTARDRLLNPTVARAQTQLTRLLAQHKDSSAALPTEQFWPAVDALHLYMLLTRPGSGSLVLQDPAQRLWLAAHLPRAWADALALTDREQAEARSVSRDYVDDLAARADDLVRRDDTLVLGVREILRRTSRGQLWADELALEQIPGAGAISLSTIASAAWLTTKEGRRVEAAYTRKGWDHVRNKIRCPAAYDDRYLAAALTIDDRLCPDERAALHGQYFKRYVESWTQFLGDIYVREPEGYKDIESQIVDMTTPGGPGVNALENLFRVVGENAQLPMVADATAAEPADFIAAVFVLARRQAAQKGIDFAGAPAAAGDQVTVATVRDAFKPYYSYGYSPPGADAGAASPLSAYILLLSKVAHPLGLYTKERNQEALTQAKTSASQVYELVHNEHFTQRDRRWTPALEGILDPPVRGLLDAINRGSLDELTMRWCNEVVYPFDTMRPCYPFNKGATCDVSGDEVAGLFQPQSGKLWQLYADKLQERFPFQGDRYVPASQGYNSRVKLNPAVARFLTNARELGEVLFPANSPAPSFSFAVQFKPLETASQITLTIDGTAISYNNSDRDRFQPMSWPGQGGAPLTRLEAQIKGGISKVEGAGFWGLYRLIEQGNVMRSGRLVVVKLLFNDRVTSAEIRLNPQDGAGNPLFGRVRALPEPGQAPEVGLMDIFREQRLSPPRQLFTNGMTCKPLNLAAAPAVPTVPPAP